MNAPIRRALPLLALAAALAVAPPAVAHEPHLELDEIAHAADVVLVGTVRNIRVYESDNGRMIFTDVTLTDMDVVHSSARAGAVGESITLTFAGGALPTGKAMSVCDQPQFTTGERWMLFAFHDGKRYLNPFIGGPQGMFRLVPDEVTGEYFPVTPGGSAITGVRDGQVSATPEVVSISAGVATCRSSGRAVMEAPVPHEGALGAATRRTETEFLPITLDEFTREVVRILEAPAPVGGILPDRDAPSLSSKWSKRLADAPVSADASAPPAPGNTRGTLCACGYHDGYGVFEQVNSGWWSYPENEQGMWMWNQYADIFRYVADDGSWGDNGDNEFGGFPSNQDLQDTWESSWGTAIAKTLMRFDAVCGEIDEADIVFNPAFTFTTDLAVSLESSEIHYQQVVMHELGHGWGYITNLGGCNEDYSYSTHSVMHAYYNNIAETGFGVHVGDAFLIRANYFPAGLAGVLDDLGGESYYVNSNAYAVATCDRDDLSGNLPIYHQGAPITLSNMSIENMGIVATTDLRARLYLSDNQTISGGDYKFPGYWEWSSFAAESSWTGDFTGVLPTSAPPGEYWIGMLVTANGADHDFDVLDANNRTFMTRKIILNPPPPSNDSCDSPIEVISGITPIDTSYAYTDGPSAFCAPDGQIHNDVWFRYIPPCDGRLTVRTCNAPFDTVIALYEDSGSCPGPLQDCNNDAFGCGVGSGLLHTIVEDQPYLIRVGAAGEGDYGPLNLEIMLDGIVPNDFCSGALVVPTGTYEVDNRCASTDGNSTACGQIYNDLWYRIVAPCDGYLVASTCDDADFDTRVAILLAAGSCPGSILYGCSDNYAGCANGTSVAIGNISEGRHYWIRVGGSNDLERGVAQLTITCHDGCADVDGSGAVDFADLNEMLDNWQMPVVPGTGGDVNFDGIVNFDDLNELLDQWGSGCP